MRWIGVFLLVGAALTVSENPDGDWGIHYPNLFEGDIILSKEQITRAEEGEDIDSSRKRGSSGLKLWPKGVVIYEIDSRLSHSARAMAAIRGGMAEWTSKTCILFKERTSEPGYVRFRSGVSCASGVGRSGLRQDIYLNSRCWTRGMVAYEIGHTIGFYHEQSRPDRDTYVTINYGNIAPGFERNFRKYPRSTNDSLGTKYGYGSVMHYARTVFSRNGKPTIVPKTSGVTIGQRQGLSPIDAQQANLLYKTECARREGVAATGPVGANLGDVSKDGTD